VGEPVASDARLLNVLVRNGYLPVVACIAGDRQGRFYNVNADQMAASIAGAFSAEKLIFLTDVDGVRGAGDRIQAEISASESQSLIDQGIATGGMEAKLKAAAAALRTGADEVVIAPGAVEGVVARLIQGDKIGTRITLEIGVSNHG